MTSPKLDLEEKIDVLDRLRFIMQTEYISATQQDQILAEITRLRKDAERAFQAQQYVDAFVLIDEADRHARRMRLELVSRQEHRGLGKQIGHMIKTFVYTDEGPLMQVFKDRTIPTRKRQLLLYDLWQMIGPLKSGPESIVLDGKTYNGTFVDILTHPQIDWGIKDTFLVIIDGGILEQEPEYLPDYMWYSTEEFMQLWEEHKKGKTKN
jgi:hypothetical protein